MNRKKTLPALFLLFTCLAVSACSAPAIIKKKPINAEARKIAYAYGIRNFDRVTAIRYTFNVFIGDKHLQRKWIWEPEKDMVTYKGNPEEKTGDIVYERKGNRDFDKKIDSWFINDRYWLLFPFHLIWDNAEIISEDEYPLPILSGYGKRLTVKYPQGNANAPGDIYEIYYGPDFLLQQWVYRKGGADNPTRITTWEEHAKVGPIRIALSHKNADGSFRLWFSDVAVRLKGGTNWLPALIY
ncbi:MAG: hypothetical protein V2I97_05730 [Desulfococcaceae bacterium]|jgi:hypothetical protein|nr:hypothetical protein [Desulfococcaceae bacterium]